MSRLPPPGPPAKSAPPPAVPPSAVAATAGQKRERSPEGSRAIAALKTVAESIRDVEKALLSSTGAASKAAAVQASNGEVVAALLSLEEASRIRLAAAAVHQQSDVALERCGDETARWRQAVVDLSKAVRDRALENVNAAPVIERTLSPTVAVFEEESVASMKECLERVRATLGALQASGEAHPADVAVSLASEYERLAEDHVRVLSELAKARSTAAMLTQSLQDAAEVAAGARVAVALQAAALDAVHPPRAHATSNGGGAATDAGDSWMSRDAALLRAALDAVPRQGSGPAKSLTPQSAALLHSFALQRDRQATALEARVGELQGDLDAALECLDRSAWRDGHVLELKSPRGRGPAPLRHRRAPYALCQRLLRHAAAAAAGVSSVSTELAHMTHCALGLAVQLATAQAALQGAQATEQIALRQNQLIVAATAAVPQWVEQTLDAAREIRRGQETPTVELPVEELAVAHNPMEAALDELRLFTTAAANGNVQAAAVRGAAQSIAANDTIKAFAARSDAHVAAATITAQCAALIHDLEGALADAVGTEPPPADALQEIAVFAARLQAIAAEPGRIVVHLGSGANPPPTALSPALANDVEEKTKLANKAAAHAVRTGWELATEAMRRRLARLEADPSRKDVVALMALEATGDELHKRVLSLERDNALLVQQLADAERTSAAMVQRETTLAQQLTVSESRLGALLEELKVAKEQSVLAKQPSSSTVAVEAPPPSHNAEDPAPSVAPARGNDPPEADGSMVARAEEGQVVQGEAQEDQEEEQQEEEGEAEAEEEEEEGNDEERDDAAAEEHNGADGDEASEPPAAAGVSAPPTTAVVMDAFQSPW